MHRIDADAHVGNLFVEGDPTVPTNPTQVDSEWLNAVQEELTTLIEAAGVTLVKNTNTQLREALTGLYLDKVTVQTITAQKTFQNGVIVTRSASNSIAISGTGNGSGAGVAGQGGATGAGVTGTGGATSGVGGVFIGGPDSLAVSAQGTGTAAGGSFTGGANGGGVIGIGGSTSGIGGAFTGTGAASGVTGGSTTGYGAVFAGNATRAPLRLTPIAAAPSTPAEGDFYVDSVTHAFMFYGNGAWRAVNTTP